MKPSFIALTDTSLPVQDQSQLGWLAASWPYPESQRLGLESPAAADPDDNDDGVFIILSSLVNYYYYVIIGYRA